MNFNIIQRPYGPLDWIITKCNISNYTFIGCLSSEDRAPIAFQVASKVLVDSHFFIIRDPENGNLQKIHEKIVSHEKNLSKKVKRSEMDLFLSTGDLKQLFDDCSSSTMNIMIDISCFPKRFFFPLIKFAINSDKVKNLIAVYTRPQSYPNGTLSENYQDWAALPLFSGPPNYNEDTREEVFFTGAGFVTMKLTKFIESKACCRILLPFPPGPPHLHRSWEFVREITESVKTDLSVIPIDCSDVAETFSRIKMEADGKKAFFAPYGPKTFSLAMCLFAISTKSPAFYTQPIEYNYEYSLGAREPYAYFIKMDGHNLYEVSSSLENSSH